MSHKHEWKQEAKLSLG